MALETISQGSVLTQVFGALKSAIMMGEFAPGQKLRIDELATAFGTSHMPVREALGQLVVLGALESPPRRSVVVPGLSADKLRDLMELRVLLETRAIELAMGNAGPAPIARLEKHHRTMAELLGRRTFNLGAYLEQNQQFHFALYEMSGNRELMNMIETAWLRYGPMLNLLRERSSLGGWEHRPSGDRGGPARRRSGPRREGACAPIWSGRPPRSRRRWPRRARAG